MNSEDGNASKRQKICEIEEVKCKLDRLQSDVMEIKSALLSVLLTVKSLDERIGSADNMNAINSGIANIASFASNSMNDCYDLIGNGYRPRHSSNEMINGCGTIKRVKLVPLYKGSTIMIDERRLQSVIYAAKKAKQAKQHCAFVSKIFTSICGVRDVYRRSRSGTAPRIKTENCVTKKKFSPHLHDELIDAAKFHFGDDINKDLVNKTITDKLQSLNSYLLKLKETPDDIPKHIIGKVTEEDLTNFKELELFKNNRDLFNQLDREFQDDNIVENVEEDEQPSAGDVECIIDWLD